MYYKTFIAVAEDCKVDEARVPQPRGDKPTAASIQYEMLANAPFTYTQEDVLFQSWLQRQPFEDLGADEEAALRDEFFAKDQACLRASALGKTHGWGIVFDEEGRGALLAVESPEYAEQLNNGDFTVVKAMRSKRK